MEKIPVKHLVSKEFQSAEAMKTLRTNLMFSGSNVRAFALTSYCASEGKSTISFQLAAAFAQAGKNVLLLDADMRKSMLASRLRVKNKIRGLSHYLTGRSDVKDLLYGTDVDGMYILFAGVRVPNSSELLGSAQFEALIPKLKESFDYIIVDAAPLGQVIDCAVMSPRLDGVIMVIDSTDNHYKLEQRIKNQIEATGGKVLGAVLNKVNFADRSSYYGKAYGYGYGYGETGK